MPGAVSFDRDELDRLYLGRLALRMGRSQAEIRAWPLADVADLLEIIRAEITIQGYS